MKSQFPNTYEVKENQTKSVELNTFANTKRNTTKRETNEITPQIRKSTEAPREMKIKRSHSRHRVDSVIKKKTQRICKTIRCYILPGVDSRQREC